MKYSVLLIFLALVAFVGCADESAQIDRPDDQGYTDPELNDRNNVAVEASIDSFVIHGSWSHPANTTGDGEIVQAPLSEDFQATLRLNGQAYPKDDAGWEEGSVDINWQGTGTDAFNNQQDETVFIKEVR